MFCNGCEPNRQVQITVSALHASLPSEIATEGAGHAFSECCVLMSLSIIPGLKQNMQVMQDNVHPSA